MKQFLKQLFKSKQHIFRVILPLIIIFGCSLFSTPAFATGVYQMPNLVADDPTWVVDEGEVVSRLNEGKIAKDLEDLAKQTGYEVRLVTFRHLDYGETPETFANALFAKWYPTSDAQANQTLLVIDTASNSNAIVTGEKVKSVMSDDIAKSVAKETLMAPLRDGNKYNQAFVDVSDRLIAVLSGQPDPGPPKIVDKVQTESTYKKAEETDKGNATAWVVGLLIAATVIPMATYYLYQVNQPPSNS
jgi:uncharacterized protein